MIFVRVIVAAAKEEEKEKLSGVTEADSIIKGRGKTNERKFVAMIDEALSYVEGEMEKATHSVCTRQLQDDANR